MDIEIADLLAELDPTAYVVDCLPNMGPEQVSERAVPLVRALRQKRSEAPIVLVEDRTATNAAFIDARLRGHRNIRAALCASYDELVAEGVQNLHYLPGADLLGDDGEGTVDGSHPTDLGFQRQASCFLPLLRVLLPDIEKTAQ